MARNRVEMHWEPTQTEELRWATGMARQVAFQEAGLTSSLPVEQAAIVDRHCPPAHPTHSK